MRTDVRWQVLSTLLLQHLLQQLDLISGYRNFADDNKPTHEVSSDKVLCPSLCFSCPSSSGDSGERVWVNRYKEGGAGFAAFAKAWGAAEANSVASQLVVLNTSAVTAVTDVFVGGATFIAGLGGLEQAAQGATQLIAYQGGEAVGMGGVAAPKGTCSFEVVTSFEPNLPLDPTCSTFATPRTEDQSQPDDVEGDAARCLAALCKSQQDGLLAKKVRGDETNGLKNPNSCLEKDYAASFKHRMLTLDDAAGKDVKASTYQYTNGVKNLEPPDTCMSLCATCKDGKHIFIGRKRDDEQVYKKRVETAKGKYSEAWSAVKGAALGTAVVLVAKAGLAAAGGLAPQAAAVSALGGGGLAVNGGSLVAAGVLPQVHVAAAAGNAMLGVISTGTSLVSASFVAGGGTAAAGAAAGAGAATAGAGAGASVAAAGGAVGVGAAAAAALPVAIGAVALVGTMSAVAYGVSRMQTSDAVAGFTSALFAPCYSTIYTVNEGLSGDAQLNWHDNCGTFNHYQVFSVPPVPWGDTIDAKTCLETLCGEGNAPDFRDKDLFDHDKNRFNFFERGSESENLAACVKKPAEQVAEAVGEEGLVRQPGSYRDLVNKFHLNTVFKESKVSKAFSKAESQATKVLSNSRKVLSAPVKFAQNLGVPGRQNKPSKIKVEGDDGPEVVENVLEVQSVPGSQLDEPSGQTNNDVGGVSASSETAQVAGSSDSLEKLSISSQQEDSFEESKSVAGAALIERPVAAATETPNA